MDTITPTFTPPADAEFLPRLARWPEAVETGIAGIQKIIDSQNATALHNFNGVCSDWTTANMRNRDFALPIAPLPIAPNELVLHTHPDIERTGVWIWQDEGAPVAVCPGLPPSVVKVKPIPEPAHVIGVPANDPVPTGTITTDAEGNKWQKQRSTSPFGTVAWWARIE